MLKFSFNNSDVRLVENLRAKGPQIIQAVTRKMDELMLWLQAKIVGEKLQGQVLQHRTGKLAASIRAIPATVEGTSVVGAVEGAGGPAFYGRFLEEGSAPHEIVPVNKAALAFILNGKQVFFKRVHHPGTQAYRFMEKSQEEMRAAMFAGLTESVYAELAK
jgi:hypothetical protein